MRILILVLSLSFLSISSCKKDDEYQSDGIITGQDLSLCGCCGGWFIEIDNTTYRFYELPQGSDFTLDNATFPVTVKLNWKMMDNACLGDEILIEDIVAN